MVKIEISNMTCGGCAKGVLAALQAAAPGVPTEVHLERREVEVGVADASPLIAALRANGWEAQARG